MTYPSGPKSGVPITITVTPRANTYGGTISYQYEYTLDGGNVWNQLALTTAASQQYTIPKGTQTFRVRVQARDNMGFTSSDWIYGPQVNVVNNSAPSAPPTITVPVSPRGGAQTTITWTASSDVDGNLAGYELERQLDGGSWTSLYTGAGLSYLDTIPKGTATVAYRVRAYDADGEYSGYTTSATRTVVNNNPPVITSSLSGDLGTKSAGFTVPYTVTDEEGGTVTVVEQVGNLVKRTHTPTLGQEQTFHVEDQDGDYFFTQILNDYDWDFVQIQLNYLDWQNQGAEQLYRELEKRNLPVMVMEPVRGGYLATIDEQRAKPFLEMEPNRSIASWAVRWVASLPQVAVVLSGMSDEQQLKDNVATMTNFEPMNEQELQAVAKVVEEIRKVNEIPCTGCRYCMDCPMGVDIPEIFAIYSRYKIFEKEKSFVDDYKAVVEHGNGAEHCVRCMACTTKCPQMIAIPDKLEMIAKLYEEKKAKVEAEAAAAAK